MEVWPQLMNCARMNNCQVWLMVARFQWGEFEHFLMLLTVLNKKKPSLLQLFFQSILFNQYDSAYRALISLADRVDRHTQDPVTLHVSGAISAHLSRCFWRHFVGIIPWSITIATLSLPPTTILSPSLPRAQQIWKALYPCNNNAYYERGEDRRSQTSSVLMPLSQIPI